MLRFRALVGLGSDMSSGASEVWHLHATQSTQRGCRCKFSKLAGMKGQANAVLQHRLQHTRERLMMLPCFTEAVKKVPFSGDQQGMHYGMVVLSTAVERQWHEEDPSNMFRSAAVRNHRSIEISYFLYVVCTVESEEGSRKWRVHYTSNLPCCEVQHVGLLIPG